MITGRRSFYNLDNLEMGGEKYRLERREQPMIQFRYSPSLWRANLYLGCQSDENGAGTTTYDKKPCCIYSRNRRRRIEGKLTVIGRDPDIKVTV